MNSPKPAYSLILPSLLLAGLFLTSPGGVAWAQVQEPATGLALNDDTGSLVMAIVKVFSALAVVVGLMLVLLHWVRKLGLGKLDGKTGSLIQVLDTKMIAPKKYIAVLQLPGERIVVGVTDQQINFLTSLGEPDPEVDNTARQKSAAPTNFSKMLRSAEGLFPGNKGHERRGVEPC